MRLFARVCTLLAGAICLNTGLHAAEDYRQQYQAAKTAKDSAREQRVLAAWKKAQPDDPEYYIAAANDLLNRDRGVTLSQREAQTGDIVLADPNTGKPVGSLAPARPSTDDTLTALGLLKTGLAKAPQRVDIRLSMALLYQRLDKPKDVLATLSAMVDYAKAHPSGLRGKGGAAYPAPVDELLASEINGFAREYFRSNNPKYNQAFHDIAQLNATAYPNRVYGHNLLGIYYTAVDDQPKLALANYQHALKVAPEDTYVLVNVGLLYARVGENQKAAESFRKVMALNNDSENVALARAELAKLKRG